MNFHRIDMTVRVGFLVLIAGLCIGLPLHAITKRGTDEMDALGTARKPLVMIAGQTQPIPAADYLSSVGGASLNGTAPPTGGIEGVSARFVEADPADNDTVIVGRYSAVGRTNDKFVNEGTVEGSFDTTGAQRLGAANVGNCATARSAGGNLVICADYYAQHTAAAGVFDYSLLSPDTTLPMFQSGFAGFGVPALSVFSPRAKVHSFGDASDPGPATATGLVQSVGSEFLTSNQSGSDGFEGLVAIDDATSEPIFQGVRARGTFASPVKLNTGDAVMAVLSKIFDGTNTQTTAGIEFYADGAQNPNVTPQGVVISTGDTTTGSRTPRVRVGATGLITVESRVTNTGSAPSVTCDGGALVSQVGGEFFGHIVPAIDSTTCQVRFAHPPMACLCSLALDQVQQTTGLGHTCVILANDFTVTAAPSTALGTFDYSCASQN